MVIDKEVEEVGDGVKAAIDANAKLASREEEGSEVRAEMGEEDGGGEAMPGCANAKWAEFAGIGRVFVKGEEVVGLQEGGSGFRDGASVDEGNDIDEGGEVRTVGGGVMRSVLGRAVCGEGSEEVDGVSEGASGSAPVRAGKGTEDKGGLEGEGGGAGMGGGAGVVSWGGGSGGGGEAFRVKGVADVGDGGWVKGSDGKVIFEAEGGRV